MTAHELLTGSSFALTPEAGGPGSGGALVSFWGRGAVTSFDGREGALTLDGEVTSALLGTEWTWGRGFRTEGAASGPGRWTAGLVLSHSEGEGGYAQGESAGEVEATLTGLFPWARHRLSERLLGRARLAPAPGLGPRGDAHTHANRGRVGHGRRGRAPVPTALDGLAANGDGGDLAARRLELGLGYGLPAFGGRFTLTPEAGAGLSNTGRDYRLGLRLTPVVDADAFELTLDAMRREAANDSGALSAAEHEVGLRLSVRF